MASCQQAIRTIAFVLCLAAMSLISGPSHALDQSQQQARLEQLRERIGQLQTHIKQTRDEHSQLNRQLERAEQQIGRLARRLRVLAGRLKRQQGRLASLQGDEARQQKGLEAEREALAEQVRSAYALGRQERIKLLLNQQDPDRMSRVFAYYDYLNRARAQRMQRIETRLSELADLGLKIGKEEKKLRGLQQDRLVEKQALEVTQVARLEVLKTLKSELVTQDHQMHQLRRDEGRLKELLAGLQKVLSDIPTDGSIEKKFSQRKGRMPWPSKGRIVASFGSAKVGSIQWDGVMISAPEGREVHAVHHGRVAYADWLRGYGLLLIIDHGDGWMSLYGHNQSLFKETGDWVTTNEPVASVGNSGGREDYGVYFGIRRKGKAVDPVAWCRRTKGKRIG